MTITVDDHGPSSNAPKLGAEDAIELRAMTALFDMARGFTLAIGRSNHATQEQTLAQALRAARPTLQLVDVRLDPHDPRGVVDQLIAAGADKSDANPDGLLVFGLADFIDVRQVQSPALTALNLNRPHLANRLSLPIVFWLPDHAVGALIRQAPDFWAVRSGTFSFTGALDDVHESGE